MHKRSTSEAKGQRSKKRWTVGLVATLVIMGGAVSATSALAKKEPPVVSAPLGAPMAHFSTQYVLILDDQNADSAPLAFELKHYSFGVENPTTIGSATGGAGAGKIKFNEFTIKRTMDQASPQIFKNCAVGSHYATATLEGRYVNDQNGSIKPFLKFKFGTVFTTKIDWSGPGDEGPEESITFVYGKLSVHAMGPTPGSLVSSSWDAIQNIVWEE